MSADSLILFSVCVSTPPPSTCSPLELWPESYAAASAQGLKHQLLESKEKDMQVMRGRQTRE
jgi:hypothetical protein